jgi:hypothetical protein
MGFIYVGFAYDFAALYEFQLWLRMRDFFNVLAISYM